MATARRAEPTIHDEIVLMTRQLVDSVPLSWIGDFDHHREFGSRPIADVLADLTTMKYGMLCGGLALAMARSAKSAGYDAVEVNIGMPQASHVLVLVKLEDGDRGIYDPTFGCYAANGAGTPVGMRAVMESIRQRTTHALQWIHFGGGPKRAVFERDKPPGYPLTSDIVRISDDRYAADIDLSAFEADAWGNIIAWARQQRPWVTTTFDCLCFPLSTSGEREAEEIAETLRTLAPQ